MVVVAAVPERTVEQRVTALQKANRIRSARAAIKCELKAGNMSVNSLIENPPPDLLSAYVYDFVRCAPKLGPVKTNRIFADARVSPSKTFGGLSDRQRTDLVVRIHQDTPYRTNTGAKLSQRRKALDRANDIRLARSGLKALVYDGEISVPDLLRQPPDCLLSMPISRLMYWERRWGRQRTLRVLVPMQISEFRRVGALTTRQLNEIARRMARPTEWREDV